MSLATGVTTIFLEKEWFQSIDDSLKVPVYGMMGSSYSFIFTYIFIDLMELLKEGLNFIHVHIVYHQKRL